uniref:Uncharacterized protein n=1 Tax=Knipowitschia caucasica TaxID=637954 RepID=A0AAV2KWQ9_KNICA
MESYNNQQNFCSPGEAAPTIPGDAARILRPQGGGCHVSRCSSIRTHPRQVRPTSAPRGWSGGGSVDGTHGTGRWSLGSGSSHGVPSQCPDPPQQVTQFKNHTSGQYALMTPAQALTLVASPILHLKPKKHPPLIPVFPAQVPPNQTTWKTPLRQTKIPRPGPVRRHASPNRKILVVPQTLLLHGKVTLPTPRQAQLITLRKAGILEQDKKGSRPRGALGSRQALAHEGP